MAKIITMEQEPSDEVSELINELDAMNEGLSVMGDLIAKMQLTIFEAQKMLYQLGGFHETGKS